MSKTVWAIADVSDGRLISSSPGVATLARELAGDGAAAIVVAANATGAAAELAAYVPHVILGLVPADEYFTPSAVAPFIARLVRERRPDYLLVPGTPTGRELAGALSALLQWGVLANATGALLADRLVVRSVVFRTDLNVQSAFTSDHGIVTVQPHAVGPSVAAATGDVEEIDVAAAERTSLVRRSELVIEEAPAPVEGARVVVAGGAGVGSKEAWALVESLAAVLDGAVGASRPAVDNGWAPYSQQIGQTGKTVRPDLYVALGISGEVQHRVGMRMSKTVVVVDKDPDAPFARFADLFVHADIAEIVPRLIEQLRVAREKGGQT